MNNKMLHIGTITSTKGLKGQLVIKSFIENNQLFFKNNQLFSSKNMQNIIMHKIRELKSNQFVIEIEGVKSIDQAQNFVASKIFINKDQFDIKPSEDEFLISDLLGLKVIYNNEIVGKIIAIEDYGNGDVLEIEANSGQLVLINFTKENFPDINFDESKIFSANFERFLI